MTGGASVIGVWQLNSKGYDVMRQQNWREFFGILLTSTVWLLYWALVSIAKHQAIVFLDNILVIA
jgi:hypothetical protein